MSDEVKFPVDTYHGLMCEAIGSFHSALSLAQHAKGLDDSDLDKINLIQSVGMQSRYSFLLAANSLESAANALILGLETSTALYNDLEKLSTLLKFEVVCLVASKRIDRGHAFYNNIKEIIHCRNEFVHPKPRMTACIFNKSKENIELDIRKTKSRKFPLVLEYVSPEHTKDAIGDILAFLAWVMFDVCQFDISEGSKRLGCGSLISTGDVFIIAKRFGFDTRTFEHESI